MRDVVAPRVVTACAGVHADSFDGKVTKCMRCGRVVGGPVSSQPDFLATVQVQLGRPRGLQTRAADGEAGTIEGLQHRFSTLGEIAVDKDVRTFEGYAVRWETMNQHREFFMPGCFRATLAKPPEGRKASLYLGHDWNQVIGEWTELREDDTGLFVKGRIIDSPIGDHALSLIREKLVTGLSIGFVADDYVVENERDWDNRIVRHKEVRLYEISLVERPSDKTAGVTALRAIRPDMTVREVENVLADLPGMPRDAAKAMASRWKPKGEGRDAPADDDAELRDAAARAETERRAREAEAATRLMKLLTG